MSVSDQFVDESIHNTNEFITKYKEEIPYFKYSNPVKHFFDHTTQNVEVLISRNKNRLLKEISLSLLNGIILASILLVGCHFLLGVEPKIGMIVTIALVSVIIIASLIGTFIPLLLDKLGIEHEIMED